jgi:hypothetical protein
MAQQDDHSIEHTSDEAERLLDELERAPHPPIQAATAIPSRPSASNGAGSPSPAASGASIFWIVLGSLAVGAVATALVITLVVRTLERAQPQGDQPATATAPTGTAGAGSTRLRPSPDPSPEPANDSASTADIEKRARTEPRTSSSSSSGEGWGPAESYKFGRVPGGEYPDSCAFSQTDSQGETIISRSRLDYWACRGEGGNAADGFSVIWADGKRTRYIFHPGGVGSMVGTDGLRYPINWSNEIRNESKVIVISHENGSISWILGQVK